MSYLYELILAIVANVISYYICKWLDGKNNNHD